MNSSFSPYPADILPVGFSYPANYLAHAELVKGGGKFHWWYIDGDTHGSMAWEWRLYYKQNGWQALSDIDPIPFARSGDWAAFFDGNDRSGDPRVVAVDLGNKAYGVQHANFETWLAKELEEWNPL